MVLKIANLGIQESPCPAAAHPPPSYTLSCQLKMMNLKVFAVVLLAACLVPASFGADVSFTNDGFVIDGRAVTCPDNNFGDVGGDLDSCKCADGSTCKYADDGPADDGPADDGPADDKDSLLPGVPDPKPLLPGVPDPSPKPSPTPSPSSSSSMAALSAVATVAVLGHLL